jgi:hypothetical protein
MQKKHVIFLQDRETVEAEPQVFKAGGVYELVDTSCDRWIKRGAARYATPDEVKAAAKAAKKGAAPKAVEATGDQAQDAGSATGAASDGDAAGTTASDAAEPAA